MSYIPDLETVDSGTVAVGWLHPDHPFPRAEVSAEFLARLQEFARRSGDSVEALGWGATGGYHTCEFCGNAWGSGSFGVLAGDRIYFVPVMIAHYVEQHEYAPPADFIAAVLACPLPGTPEYMAAARTVRQRLA